MTLQEWHVLPLDCVVLVLDQVRASLALAYFEHDSLPRLEIRLRCCDIIRQICTHKRDTHPALDIAFFAANAKVELARHEVWVRGRGWFNHCRLLERWRLARLFEWRREDGFKRALWDSFDHLFEFNVELVRLRVNVSIHLGRNQSNIVEQSIGFL